MPQLTEPAAELLSPEQTTELVRMLDLHAIWDNHRSDPTKSAATHPDLHARQKAFDAFQVAWRGYAAKCPGVTLPEPSQNMPDRLAAWSRVLRVIFRRADGVCPVHLMSKVYRLADVIAAKRSEEPVERLPTENLSDAVRELDVVIAWCNRLAKPPTPLSVLLKARVEQAA